MISEKKRGTHRRFWVIAASFLLIAISMGVLLLTPSIQPWWRTLTQESRRILGGGREEAPSAEKRIRDELIFKRMEEATLRRDWRALAPDYPRPPKEGVSEGKAQGKAVKESQDFKEMDREVKDFLRKKEDLIFHWEPPSPPLKNPTDFGALRDRGSEEVVGRLLKGKEKAPVEKPLEENLRLGIKGSLASRKILERPGPPQTKVRVEAEIELTFWVLPNGTVDRVVPSVRGDAELERIAIQYLKQWRFAPLPPGQAEVTQWGTIPIKFKLE
jgi:TonB family protein